MLRDTTAQQGHEFRAGVARAAERVAAFDPQLVVFFGSDHRRAFVDSVPAIAVMTEAEGLGDLGSATGRYDIPAKTADELAGALLDRDFDVTVVQRPPWITASARPTPSSSGELPTVPVIPIYQLRHEAAQDRPSRAFALGRAVREELSYLDQRILFIGSGGLSHSPPSLVSAVAGLSDAERLAMNEAGREAAKDKINPAWDNEFLRRIAADPDGLKRLTSAEIETAGVGAHEVRTWIAAIAAGNRPMEIIAYEPVREWITGMGVVTSRRPADRAEAILT
jgi:2,3-dihydroxyphenylpropionate 1,2-dioxygenase